MIENASASPTVELEACTCRTSGPRLLFWPWSYSLNPGPSVRGLKDVGPHAPHETARTPTHIHPSPKAGFCPLCVGRPDGPLTALLSSGQKGKFMSFWGLH